MTVQFFFLLSFFYSFGGGEGCNLDETIKDMLIGNKNWTFLKCFSFFFFSFFYISDEYAH